MILKSNKYILLLMQCECVFLKTRLSIQVQNHPIRIWDVVIWKIKVRESGVVIMLISKRSIKFDEGLLGFQKMSWRSWIVYMDLIVVMLWPRLSFLCLKFVEDRSTHLLYTNNTQMNTKGHMRNAKYTVSIVGA